MWLNETHRGRDVVRFTGIPQPWLRDATAGWYQSSVSDIAREARSGMERDPWLGAAARRRSSYWPVIGTGGAGTGPSMM